MKFYLEWEELIHKNGIDARLRSIDDVIEAYIFHNNKRIGYDWLIHGALKPEDEGIAQTLEEAKQKCEERLNIYGYTKLHPKFKCII